MAREQFYTLTGAAEYKKTYYPTVRAAIDRKDLVPIKANVGLTKAREVELISKEQLDAWEPRRNRLTEDQRIERAAKLMGITPAQMRAALKDKK